MGILEIAAPPPRLRSTRMNAAPPEVSVVIPTYQRSQSLARALAALAHQDLPPDRFEAIVIPDGPGDEAIDFLSHYSGPMRLRWREQPPSGAGPARNRGATLAAGRVLVFLDDDIEPGPGLVRAHLNAAAEGECVGIGDLTTVLPQPPGLLGTGMRNCAGLRPAKDGSEGTVTATPTPDGASQKVSVPRSGTSAFYRL